MSPASHPATPAAAPAPASASPLTSTDLNANRRDAAMHEGFQRAAWTPAGFPDMDCLHRR